VTWRDRLVERRDNLERWVREDEANRREGFADPGSKNLSDSMRPDISSELGELRLICELLADASECF
jgi:hypothetical protein